MKCINAVNSNVNNVIQATCGRAGVSVRINMRVCLLFIIHSDSRTNMLIHSIVPMNGKLYIAIQCIYSISQSFSILHITLYISAFQFHQDVVGIKTALN